MAERPGGTITFLFTDIEGSSQRWREQPAAMKTALARHDALLRQAIEDPGGFVFKTVGDAFYGAFPTAPDALQAALWAQRALFAEHWQGLDPLRVRMALHTGTADEREGDYFGPTLTRVARLLSAGNGGQTLLSQVTYELVRDHLPPDVELRDLGEHRLKDLARPERVYQVVTPDLPADFGPLHTLDRRPHNLPVQPTPLIGREAETRQVAALLRRPEVRLVTLTGPGGTGKTRLGLQVAADILDDFADGVVFVALASVTDPALVGHTLAQTLNIREQTGRPPLDSLKDYLRDKQLLLLLDNFEQVVEAAPLVAEVLAAAPRLKALVTSRVVLRVSGEYDFDVPPLALPPTTDDRRPPTAGGRRMTDETGDTKYEIRITQYEAVRLFIERATAAKADFAITNENAPAVAEICHRLDGLPLAIELAAARIRLLSPQAILARLAGSAGQTPLRLLTGGSRDLPARQQTLRNAIEWSYHLLDEADKTLFRRLAVFAGGCTLDAIEAVCADDEGRRTEEGRGGTKDGVTQANPLDPSPLVLGRPSFVLRPDAILDGVESLVAKSLVRRIETAEAADEPRFGMLVTIREFGLEQLAASGEAEEVRQRHADFYLRLAEEAQAGLHRPGQLTWLARLDAEADNFRALMDWAQATGALEQGLHCAVFLFPAWFMRGSLAEARRWFEGFLAQTSPTETSLARAVALFGVGAFAAKQADFVTALSDLTESVALLRQLGEERFLTLALLFLGDVEFERAGYTVARAAYEEVIALARRRGDTWTLATALTHLGEHLTVTSGQLDAAQRLSEESLALLRRLGDRWGQMLPLSHLARLALLRGEYPSAQRSQQEILAIAREFGDLLSMSSATEALAGLALLQGDLTRAEEYYTEALRLLQQVGSRQGMGYMDIRLGDVAYAQGRLDRAGELLHESLSISQERGDEWTSTEALRHLARVRLAQGQTAEAARLYADSLARCHANGDVYCVAESLAGLGGVAAAQGEPLRAATLYGAALALHDAHGLPVWPPDRAEYDHQVTPARARLDPAAFAEAEAAGRAMTLDDAVGYAAAST